MSGLAPTMPAATLKAEEAHMGEVYAEQQLRGFRRLRFEEPLEREYLAAMRAAKRPGTLICIATALVIWLVFVALDLSRLDLAAEIANRRYDAWLGIGLRWTTLALLTGLLIALLRGGLKTAYPWGSMLTLVMIGATAAINACVYKLRGLPQADLAEFAIIMAVFLPLGMTFRQSTVTALLVAGATATAGLVMLDLEQRYETVRMSVLLLFAAFVGAVGAYLREYAERDQFLLRRQLHYGAMQDALTGIGNRRYFAQHAAAALRQAAREREDVVLAVLDVDHFKSFNDRYGHHAGDMALHRVAQSLKQSLRRPLDLVGRLGSEEFGLLLYGAEPKEALTVLEAVVATVANLSIAHEASETANCLTVSIGAACFDGRESLESLYKRADAALYESKAAGRNRAALDDMAASLLAATANDQLPPSSRWRR